MRGRSYPVLEYRLQIQRTGSVGSDVSFAAFLADYPRFSAAALDNSPAESATRIFTHFAGFVNLRKREIIPFASTSIKSAALRKNPAYRLVSQIRSVIGEVPGGGAFQPVLILSEVPAR